MAQKETTNTRVFNYNLFVDKSISDSGNNDTQFMQKLSYANQQELIHCKKAVIASK